MFNPVPVETQKKLVFIPCVNIAIPFIWQINCTRSHASIKEVFIGWISALACLLPFGLIQFLCAKLLPDWQNYCALLIIYFAPLLMGHVLIKHQERLEQALQTEPVCQWRFFKRNRRAWMIGLVVAVAFVLILSAVLLVLNDINEKHIADQNGAEDHTLAVLTMEDILSVHSRNVVINSGSVKSGGQTDVEGHLSEYDRDSVKVSIGSISGVRTIHATNTQADYLKLTIDSRLESGNAAIVIVVDGEFYGEVAVNAQETVEIPKAAGKLVEVRLAGESAKIKVTINRNVR